MAIKIKQMAKIIDTELKCRFCEAVCGTLGIPEGTTLTDHGVIDTRCSACEKEHGEFKAMVDKAVLDLSMPPAEAQAFVLAHGARKADFEKAHAKKFGELEAERVKVRKEAEKHQPKDPQ